MSKRNELEIEAEILRLALPEAGIKKSHIVYRANLNFNVIKRYLANLIQNGLLKPADETADKRTSKLYTTTNKGISYLARLQELQSFKTSMV